MYNYILHLTFSDFVFNLCPQVQNLSGGELQRVALTLCLGKPADVYLIDEPSAYLDSEQRLHAGKVIKRLVAFDNLYCRFQS